MTPDNHSRLPRVFAALAAGLLCAAALSAATYLPLSDTELARRAPVIVRARVVSREMSLETADGGEIVLTRTGFQVLEVLKGRMETASFQIGLPGGELGGVATWIPGTPSFAPDSEVVLFLSPPSAPGGDFSLTEFALSKFDVLEDRQARRFAVRTVFDPGEDDYLSGRSSSIDSAGAGAARRFRDADSFASALQSAAQDAEPPEILYAEPDGELRRPGEARSLWVNIGGSEGSGSLYRWFWDTGQSPAAIVSAAGTQSGLSDGSNGLSSLANAVTQWSSIPGAIVRYSQSGGSAPVVVAMDVESKSPYWTTALSCPSGGIIGLGGPGAVSSAGSFKGDSGYYAARSGNVWMRKVTGGCYSYQTFRTAVMHELGHTLGLGHSDQGTSVHSNTAASDWASAVMVSSVPPSRPSTPQNDDIQAILWYYGSGSGSGSGAVAPTADFSFSPTAPSVGETVRFLDASAGGATSWAWSFGDAAAGLANFSSLANPVHVFPAPGSYTVTLTATNASGSSRVTRAVIISGCVPGPDALCFNNGRFRAAVFWRVPSRGMSGPGWAVPITGASGYFWFFSPSNVELIVKVLDGRAVNGNFWVFYGALSNVEYTLTVTDTKTGAVKSYFNPEGRLTSAADTAAFASDTEPVKESKVQGPKSKVEKNFDPGSTTLDLGHWTLDRSEMSCSPDPGILCVNGSRFRVQVSWRVPSQGTQGTATAVPLTTDTGYFWFFASSTPELVVKVLDGTAVNGRFWVFSGALSDVEYTITVTDTMTGAVKTYLNPSGSLSSLADTNAF